jgi:hypothetical protein
MRVKGPTIKIEMSVEEFEALRRDLGQLQVGAGNSEVSPELFYGTAVERLYEALDEVGR